MFKAKEDEVYIVLPDGAAPSAGLCGVFFRDTVCFDAYAWNIDGAMRLAAHAGGNLISEFHSVLAPDRSQTIGLRRALTVNPAGFHDCWTLTNTTQEAQSVSLSLHVRPRFIDLFALRTDQEIGKGVECKQEGETTRVYRRAGDDGVVFSARLNADPLPKDLSWRIVLEAGESRTLNVHVAITSTDYNFNAHAPLPSQAEWRESFVPVLNGGPGATAASQAVDDLRTLLLSTIYGAYPAAGMPIFVNFFGRDALITAMMLKDWRPDILKSVLAFLAAHQGQVVDTFREEEPGKILHEVRRGELSRTNKIPFGRYYGSVDSTPLFLMAADAYFAAVEDADFKTELAPSIERALDWLTTKLDSPSGLATFEASGSGLTVQSWKDSANSMVDEFGRPAKQPLAVAEVQGYSFAALQAAARLIDHERPNRLNWILDRAETLRETFQRLFWLPDLQSYAMALDADMKPLRVLSSDPGHLLWTGIVPEKIAPLLVKTMLGKALWSGWGVRTLGKSETAYNPVSYHNGSVWPHDTGIFAMGLKRHGFEAELREVAKALIDLAEASPGRQMPELISGFDRCEHPDPVPYTHANTPQAWSAATVICMASYLAQPIEDDAR